MKQSLAYAVLTLAIVLVLSISLEKAKAQAPSQNAGGKNAEEAIVMLDHFVKHMDAVIAIAQKHRTEALKKRKVLAGSGPSEAKISNAGYLTPGTGPAQELGWCVEHPFQCAGKTYDKYKDAVDEENKANEEWLRQQKKAKEQQEKKQKKRNIIVGC